VAPTLLRLAQQLRGALESDVFCGVDDLDGGAEPAVAAQPPQQRL
jgi:hypothetical protein